MPRRSRFAPTFTSPTCKKIVEGDTYFPAFENDFEVEDEIMDCGGVQDRPLPKYGISLNPGESVGTATAPNQLAHAAHPCKIFQRLERWQSGLTRTPGKWKTSSCPQLD